MRKLPQLVPIIHHDKDILLKCFSDTLVYHKENGKRSMVAIRFGGYPEQVRGMSDAMYGGIAVEAEIEQHRVIISTQKKQCRRKLSHDGVYAEAMLIALDDESTFFVRKMIGMRCLKKLIKRFLYHLFPNLRISSLMSLSKTKY